MDGLGQEQRRLADGASLVGILLIVVVLGALTAAAAVGVSTMNDSTAVVASVARTDTTNSARSSGVNGVGSSNGRSELVACQATADGARSASTLYFANNGGAYPATWSDLTTSSPPMFSPAANVTINPANPKELDGRDWKLVLAGGGASAPTFTCR